MNKIRVLAVGNVSWEYVPKEQPHSGTLKVTIPGRSQVRSRTSDLQFDLRFFITDQRSAQRSNNPVDPLYDTTEPPFLYFVDVRRHNMGEVAMEYQKEDLNRKWPQATFKVVPAEHITVAVQIFALRGVHVYAEIDLPNGKRGQQFAPLLQKFERLTIDARVNVLQDRSQFPEPGEPIENNRVFPSFESDNDHLGGNPLRRALGRISVKHIPNGIEFSWFYLGQTLRLERAAPSDGRSGFSYYLNPNPKFPREGPLYLLEYDDLLHIRTCGNVKKTLTPIKNPIEQVRNMGDQAVFYRRYFVDPFAWADHKYPRFRTGRSSIAPGRFRKDWKIHRPLFEARFFRIEQVERLADLYPPHTPFSVERISKSDEERYKKAEKEYLGYYKEPEVPLLVRLAVDLGVGAVPILGDVVDYYEFNLMLATGKDRWGKQADGVDIVLAGISVIPVLGIAGSVARKARRAIQ